MASYLRSVNWQSKCGHLRERPSDRLRLQEKCNLPEGGCKNGLLAPVRMCRNKEAVITDDNGEHSLYLGMGADVLYFDT